MTDDEVNGKNKHCLTGWLLWPWVGQGLRGFLCIVQANTDVISESNTAKQSCEGVTCISCKVPGT